MPTKKKPAITNAERLAHPCPACHAKAGDPCIDPRGDHTDGPHKTRGPGQYARHLQQEIDRRAAREKASYGPLFQELAEEEVKPPTVLELAWQKRYAFARAAENSDVFDQAMNGMEWIRLQHIRRTLATIIGEWWAEELWRYATEVYRNNRLYIEGFLANALCTTDRKAVRVELRSDPARVKVTTWKNLNGVDIEVRHDGRYLADAVVWPPLVLASLPVMTREEFRAMFPPVERERKGSVDAEPGDGGLFERVMGAMRKAG